MAINLDQFPRIRLGHWPTPLEPMRKLAPHLGSTRLYIKRDDCTGLATGGNKTRKLEYLMADAVVQGADTVITQGATQSNHARQTVAAACKLGMQSHILLEDRTGYSRHEYKKSGNVFLDAVPYTHPNVPTNREVEVSVGCRLIQTKQTSKHENEHTRQ